MEAVKLKIRMVGQQAGDQGGANAVVQVQRLSVAEFLIS